MNNVIKEARNYNAVDIVSLLEVIKEKLFQQQKDELIRGIHGMGEYRLVPLEDCDIRNIPLPHGTLKELWAISEFLLANDAIFVLIGGNSCVKGVDMAYTVILKSCKNGTLLKCTCKTYALFDGICPHILTVAEKRGELKSVF